MLIILTHLSPHELASSPHQDLNHRWYADILINFFQQLLHGHVAAARMMLSSAAASAADTAAAAAAAASYGSAAGSSSSGSGMPWAADAGSDLHPEVYGDLPAATFQPSVTKALKTTRRSFDHGSRLPPPFFAGNDVHVSGVCSFAQHMSSLVVWNQTRGFDMVDDAAAAAQGGSARRQRKWGLVSVTKGDVMVIHVDTTLGGSVGPVVPPESIKNKAFWWKEVANASKAVVDLGYVQSYEGFGAVQVACSGGCICNVTYINALDTTRRTSQTQFAKLEVTASPRCLLTLTNVGSSLEGAVPAGASTSAPTAAPSADANIESRPCKFKLTALAVQPMLHHKAGPGGVNSASMDVLHSINADLGGGSK